MDRTNWKYGKTHINILFLAMGYNNFTIPILWKTLPQNKKSGNSCTHERIELIKKFISIFGNEMIQYITGDREFIGKLWFKYLIDNNIKFVIRLKCNTKVSRINGGFSPVKNFFHQLKIGEAMQLDGMRKVFGLNLYITGMKLPSGELLIVASYVSDICDQVLNDYKKRWGIECLFKALKCQDFDFETTHLTDPKKIDKLIALMAIACVWACKTGQWLNDEKEIAIKKHGRKAISVFRYGLDYLRGLFLNVNENFSQLQVVLGFIQSVSIPIHCNLTC
jgi:transposase